MPQRAKPDNVEVVAPNKIRVGDILVGKLRGEEYEVRAVKPSPDGPVFMVSTPDKTDQFEYNPWDPFGDPILAMFADPSVWRKILT